MSGGFKRSGLFGLIGVFVVAAIIVVIALNPGQGEANPKTTFALIFGVLAVFLVVLFALQRADLNRVSGADARGTARGAAEGGRQVDNPTTLSEPDLWAAMADRGYDSVGKAMAPLGLEVTEQPSARTAERWRTAGRRRRPEGHAELDPLEESHGRGRPGGHQDRPQGRRAGRLALRPLARRAAS